MKKIIFFILFAGLISFAKAQTAYITNSYDNTVSVINVATNDVTTVIPVGSSPYGVSVSPDGSKVYVANNLSNTLSVINAATNTVSATIPIGANPFGVSVSPDGSKVYVTNSALSISTVSVLSTATNTVTDTITVGYNPQGICISPDGSKIYVANYNASGTVSVINTATDSVTTKINVGGYPIGISVSPDGSRVYVANEADYTVSVINTATDTVSATIAVGTEPFGVSVSPDGSKVYVANYSGNTISVINTATNDVTATIPVGTNPIGVSVSPDGSKVYIANQGANEVSVINSATNIVSDTIPVGNRPYAFGNFISTYIQPTACQVYFNINPDTSNSKQIYFSNTSSGNINSWNWYFGDETTSTLQNPTHTYANYGKYDVCLMAYDTATGGTVICYAHYCDTIFIGSSPTDCHAYFSHIVDTINANKIYFSNYSSANTNSWSWSFGDGLGSGDQNPTHTYATAGTYYVCLYAAHLDSAGNMTCSNTYCDSVVVNNTSTCQVYFSYDSTSTYTYNFTSYISSNINYLTWDFGDSTHTSAPYPTHIYAASGTYHVCLTGYDVDTSSHVICYNYYCTYITVGIPTDSCHAYFGYHADTTHTNTIDFVNYSTNTNSWSWSFGDSTTSGLQNPVHTYANAGTYYVCLFAADYSGDTLICSNHYCTTIVVGTQPIACQAYYVYYADTAHSNSFYFYNYSSGSVNTWLWSFGDSTTSTLQYPTHTFAGSGQYMVCLTASDVDTNGNVLCSSTYCNWVYIYNFPDSTYSIHGKVSAGGAAAKAAVILYNTDYTYYNAVNYDITDSTGAFIFNNVRQGHYILWAVPDTTTLPYYLPTYFGDVLYWQNAYDSLYINANTYDVNIHLVPLDSASGHLKILTNNGSISGTVQFDNNMTYEVNIFGQNWFNALGKGSSSTIAGKNIPVFLKNTNGDILDWALANDNGDFAFSNLVYQGYTVNAEKASLQSVSPIISLTAANPTVNNVSINIGVHNIVTSVKEINYDILSSLTYYPNPVKDNLNLVLNLQKNAMVDVSILNITGQEIMRNSYSLPEGSNNLALNMSDLSSGMYFIRINTNNSNAANFKIIK